MNIKPTQRFLRDAKHLNKKFPSFKSDLSEKLETLIDNPHQGKSLGRSAYKIRLAITSKGRGKSGGARLITLVKIERETIYLLAVYDKSESENLDANELDELLTQVPE